MLEQYAHRIIKDGREVFLDIFPSIRSTRMCGGDEPIYHLRFEEDAEGDYFGWRDKTERISMIYPNFTLLSICFPYGIDHAKSHGGDVVRLRISEITNL